MRYIDDELGVELAALAADGIHEPGRTPFAIPWSDVESPALERNALQFYWRCRAETSPTKWTINFAAIVAGTVVGTTSVMAAEFPRLRQFETGSWLGRAWQGRGIGKEMRVATLTLGFDGFDADIATTSAWHDNAPSLGVTRSLGYTRTGTSRLIRNDADPDRLIAFEMPRTHFEAEVRRDDVELVGVDGVRDLLGLSPGAA